MNGPPQVRLRMLLALAVIGVLILIFFKTRQSNTAPEEVSKQAILKVLNDQVTAWNMGDLEGFMAGYWQDDGLLFYSGKDKTNGYQATFDRYRKKYKAEGQEMGTLDFSELETELLSPECAIVRGRWRLRVAKKEPNEAGGLFTLVFKKKPQGWCIVSDHTSK